MKASVQIVTYNSGNTIKACLDSLVCQQGIEFEVIVLDNQSTDRTIDIVRRFGGQVQLIENSENAGFGRGHNKLSEYALGDFLWILNPDAFVKKKTALKSLCDWMQSRPKIGLCGTAIDETKRVVLPRMKYPGEKYAGVDFGDLPGENAWVVGSSMFLSARLFSMIGGFDPDFFMYGEETDLCLRIRKQGYEIGYCPEVGINHVRGESEKKTSTYDLWIKRENGKHLFYKKHYPLQYLNLLVRELRSARFRILKSTLPACLGNARAVQKKDRYRAVRDQCLRALVEE